MSKRPAWTSPSTACGAIPSSISRFRAVMELSRTTTSSVTGTAMSQCLFRRRPRRRRQREVPDDGGGLGAIGRVGRGGAPTMEGPDVRRGAGDVLWVRAAVDRLAVVVDKRERDSGLLAPAYLKAEREGSCEIVAGEAGLDRQIAGAGVGPVLDHGQADFLDEGAPVRDDEIASGGENPGEFAEHGLEVRNVHQGERADHQVDMVVGQWEVVQVSLVELPAWHLLSRALQHRG